jgi:hypothetical protein
VILVCFSLSPGNEKSDLRIVWEKNLLDVASLEHRDRRKKGRWFVTQYSILQNSIRRNSRHVVYLKSRSELCEERMMHSFVPDLR